MKKAKTPREINQPLQWQNWKRMMFSYELMIAFIYNVQEHMKTRNMGKIIDWTWLELWTWLEVDSIIIYGGQRTPKFTITGLQKRNRISFCLHRAEKSCSFFRLTRNIWFYSKRFRRQTWSSLSVQVSPRISYEVY